MAGGVSIGVAGQGRALVQDNFVSSVLFNLERASVLLLDGDATSKLIIEQILFAFGARNVRACTTVDEAYSSILQAPFDLIIVDPGTDPAGVYDFVKQLRRTGHADNQFVPVLVVTGHTQLADVSRARDCGANFVLAKPLTADVLYERFVWLARENRQFIACAAYVGPDRRFNEEHPEGSPKRRSTDRTGGAAVRLGPKGAVGATG